MWRISIIKYDSSYWFYNIRVIIVVLLGDTHNGKEYPTIWSIWFVVNHDLI